MTHDSPPRPSVRSWIHGIACTLAFAALSGSAVAQPDFEPLRRQRWSASPGPAGELVTRLVAGDLTGDDHADLIALDDGVPILCYGFDLFTSLTPITTVASDIAIVESTSGGRDTLVAVGASGLTAFWVDYDDPGEVYIQSDALAASADWDGGARIIATTAPGGASALVGLNATSTKVLRIETPLAASRTEPAAINLPSPALDLVPLDWSGDAALEIAVLSADALRVYTWDGTLLFNLPAGFTDGTLATIHEAVYSHDRLAVVTTLGGSSQNLLVLSQSAADTPLGLGSNDVYSMIAADFDGDGNDDLALANRSSAAIPPMVLINDSSGAPVQNGVSFSFGTGQYRSLSLDLTLPPAPLQNAQLVAHDFTRDGDVDLAYLSVADGDVVLAENDSLSLDSLRVDADTAASCATLHKPGAFVQWAVMKLKLDPPASIPAGSTHLLIEEWVQIPQTHEWVAELHPMGGYRFLRPIPSDWQEPLTLALWDEWVDPQHAVYLDIRFVTVSGPDIVATGPSACVGLSIYQYATESAEAFLAAEHPAVALLEFPLQCTTPSNPPSGGAGPSQKAFPAGLGIGDTTLGVGGGEVPEPPDTGGDGNPPRPPNTDGPTTPPPPPPP